MLHCVPVSESITADICERCTRPIFNKYPFIKHSDVCEYQTFVNVEAPKRNFVSIDPTVDDKHNGIEIITMFDTIGIDYVAFALHSPINRGHHIFVAAEIAHAIGVYKNRHEAFAGMSLEEYLQRMFGKMPE